MRKHAELCYTFGVNKIFKKIPRVAICLSGAYTTHLELLDGILRFTHMRSPWITDIRMGRYDEKMKCTIPWDDIDGLITWQWKKEFEKQVLRTGIPVITEGKIKPLPNTIASVVCDNSAITKLAAEHLISKGLSNFAFVPVPNDSWWSDEREEKFVYEIESFNKSEVRIFDSKKFELSQWLISLPKPVGILAVDDIRAREVSDAAHSIGIRIPDEIAVIGIDNDTIICETTTPSISSIGMNTRDAGFTVAEKLHNAILAGRVRKKSEQILYGGEVIERQSTRHLPKHDFHVSRCLELMEANLSEHFTVDDLQSILHISRRSLETKFKAITGRTIHQEILDMRISRAKKLLRNSALSQEKIAEACGFHDASHLNAVFRRICGSTPSTFRSSTH